MGKLLYNVSYHKFCNKVLTIKGILVNSEDFFISQLPQSHKNGDDGAIVGEWVYSQDAFFENVHFKKEWMTFSQIGYKAMIVNISDAIAMNAIPKYALLTVAFPHSMTKKEIKQLIQGINQACREFDIEIIGGDTIANIKLDLSITIISQSISPLLREGLHIGDFLAFTGDVGSVQRDLEKLFNGKKVRKKSKFFQPILRQEFISHVRPYINVGMDISDGIGHELKRLSRINHVSFNFIHELTFEQLCSGEEYEMIIGFSSHMKENVIQIAHQTQTPLTIFAEVKKGKYQCPCQPHHF